MIAMTVIIKIKMILLHLDNHKNASKILLQLFIKFYIIFLCLISIKIIFFLIYFLLDKTPLGETGFLNNFLGSLSMSPSLHPGFSVLLRSPPALRSTPTTFGCLLFLMFMHPVF